MSAESTEALIPLAYAIAREGRYTAWVSTPERFSSTPRLFKHRWLDALTKTRWFMVPVLWLPAACACALNGPVHPTDAVLCMLAGGMLWITCEYVLHRYVFHAHVPSSPMIAAVHFCLHGCHHKAPRDEKRLVLPPVLVVPLIACAWAMLKVFLASFERKCAALAGFILAYTLYDLVHYLIHTSSVRSLGLGAARAHHLKHHFHTPNARFGVLTSMLDRACCTL